MSFLLIKENYDVFYIRLEAIRVAKKQMQDAKVHFLIGVDLEDDVGLCGDGRNHSRTFRATAFALR